MMTDDHDRTRDHDDAQARRGEHRVPGNFVPEATEIEPAGGIIERPPSPEEGERDPPAEGIEDERQQAHAE